MSCTSNVNPETGIRYGVISLNSLDADVVHELWIDGDNLSEREALDELREEVTTDMEAENEERDEPLSVEDMQDEIERRVEGEWSESYGVEEPTIEGDCDGIKYLISWLGGAPLLWVLESPYTTYARLCSPCVPNAGDLESLDAADGYECYDVHPAWRKPL